MLKIIAKQFLQYWKIWLALLPIFIVSGIVFSTSLILLTAMATIPVASGTDYGVFMQTPIIIGGVVLCLLTNNAMKQCIDFFDDTNDVMLLLGASPVQLSFLMTGQVLLTGVLGAVIGMLFAIPAGRGFLSLLPVSASSESLVRLPLSFSWQMVRTVLILQALLIVMTCMRYCLKTYQRRKGALVASLHKHRKIVGSFLGIVTLIASLVVTILLFLKPVPDPTSANAYNNSMKGSMNFLLLLWPLVIISMNFLIRPLFIKMVRVIVHIPSMAKQPMIRSAFHDLQHHEEAVIKLIRPVSVIVLLAGNFIALFLNTKLLVDGNNGGAVIYDLAVSLIFVFGAPIMISLASILTSISLFKMKTAAESDHYFFSGCTPSWIFNLKLTEIGAATILAILITFLGTSLFAIPLLRVAFLGGGDLSKANWTVNILLTFGVFGIFSLCLTLVYWSERTHRKAYVNE